MLGEQIVIVVSSLHGPVDGDVVVRHEHTPTDRFTIGVHPDVSQLKFRTVADAEAHARQFAQVHRVDAWRLNGNAFEPIARMRCALTSVVPFTNTAPIDDVPTSSRSLDVVAKRKIQRLAAENRELRATLHRVLAENRLLQTRAEISSRAAVVSIRRA